MHPLGTNLIGSGARAVIDRYLALPLGPKPSCPYFNNRRRNARGNLRALAGKGTPEEIVEEAQIRAIQSRIEINSLSTDKLKEFLIANDLGVDCSGFAYHVLSAELFAQTGASLGRALHFQRPGFVGSLIARFRPAENAGVSTFAHEANSIEIKASETMPGDFIVFMGTGKDKTYNHIVVVSGVDRGAGDDQSLRLSYAHSYAWPSDGVSGHGVREGDILVRGDDLLGAIWKERGAVGADNYTHQSALDAQSVSVRRLKAFK